jgi:hypothetical protein
MTFWILFGYYLVTRALFSWYCYWCYTSGRGVIPHDAAAWTNGWALLPVSAELLTVIILCAWAAEKNPILRLYQWLEARGNR